MVTCLVLNLTNKNNSVISWKTYIIICINFVHILIGGLDQFFEQLIFGEGHTFLKARDVGLVMPDVLHVVLCLWEVYAEVKRKSLKVTELCQKKEAVLCSILTMGLFVIGRNL